MATPCNRHEQLERFADGELAPGEAEAFRDHLLDCDACRLELGDLLHLKDRVARQAERQPARVIPLSPFRALRRPALAAAGLAGLSLAAALVMVVFLGRSPGADPWLLAEPERRVEARLAYAAADRHRPLAAQGMGASAPASGRLPLEAMAELEREGDGAGLAAAYLVRNDRSLAEQALAALAPLGDSPEIATDRGAGYLALGDAERALRSLDAALEGAPRLGPALWNRALALRALDLRLGAALAFEQVANLGEPGWSGEARQRAADLRSADEAQVARWEAGRKAGAALAESGTLPPPSVLADRPPVLRLFFYDAVRTRTSRKDVEALLPLARELDGQVGGDALARYVARVAESDFARRAPLAGAYEQLRRGAVPKAEVQPLLDRLLRAGEDDLLLGALVHAGAVAAHLDLFAAKAEATGDPWFRLLAIHERARAHLARREAREAKRMVEDGLRACAAVPIPYRCLQLELDLAEAASQLARLDEAWEHASRAFRQGRATNELTWDDVALGHLGQLSRLRGDLPLARAYLEEALLRGGGKDAEKRRHAHQLLAHLALGALRWDTARSEIDRAIDAKLPLTPVGAMALADIARQRPSRSDEEVLERALAGAAPSASAGQKAILEHALGRLLLERDRPRGRQRLEEVLRTVEAGDLLGRDEDARRARAYSYTSLILDEGKAGDHAAALELFGRELGGPLPERCAVAVTEDSERSLAIVRGASGGVWGDHQGARARRLPDDLAGFLGAAGLEALRGCEAVSVFARPPLQGRAGLLPPSLAWSYRLRPGEPPAPPAGKPIHLVVQDVSLAPERVRALGQLNPWRPSFGDAEERRVLQGAEATPARVLSAMRGATEIDLVAHGVINPGSDASYLALAMDAGRDELTAAEIREQRLEGAPLVVLAACRGARAAPVLYEPVSLPAAFIRAGARGVIAAAVEIPDLEAADFFAAVRERIRGGASPAAALRDARMSWLGQGKGRSWVESVFLYE